MVLGFTLPMPAQQTSSGCDEGVEFRIVTDKTSYAPGSLIYVKFLVTNTIGQPLYFFRPGVLCSGQEGSFRLSIRDERGTETFNEGCAADSFPDPNEVTNYVITGLKSDVGIKLDYEEVYGKDSHFVLPKKKGIYHLRAELVPMGYFTDEVKKALAENHMRAPQHVCQAPTVTITVK